MTPKRILVVDDDRVILGLVAVILGGQGYDVETANGGREALSMIEVSLYDVIVLDLVMPEVNGVDVLKSLHARIPEVKCVVIMSAASSFDIARATNPNVFAAVRKPFNIAEMIGAVAKCIEATCGPSSHSNPFQRRHNCTSEMPYPASL